MSTRGLERRFGVHRNRTVLLVDEDNAVLSLLQAILATHGYRVLAASSLTAALDLLRLAELRVDLVAVDMTMTGIAAEQLAGMLASCRPGVPVLFMSAETDQGIIRVSTVDPRNPSAVRYLPDAVRQALLPAERQRAQPAPARNPGLFLVPRPAARVAAEPPAELPRKQYRLF